MKKKTVLKLLFITSCLVAVCSLFYNNETSTLDSLAFQNVEALAQGENDDDAHCYGYGSQIGSGSETAGIVSGNIVLPVTEISSTAQFKISPQQFELLKKGVAKIRLSTIPIEHERTFAKDKIGKKLYQFFLKQKNKDNDF